MGKPTGNKEPMLYVDVKFDASSVKIALYGDDDMQ